MDERDRLHDSIVGQASFLSELAASHVEVILREFGLGFGAFDLLAAVSAADERATQADLARRLGIAPPSLSEMAKTLSAKGLIRQVPSEHDRRVKRVTLTPKGREIFVKCMVAVRESEALAVEDVAEDELAIAVKVLQQAAKNLMKRHQS